MPFGGSNFHASQGCLVGRQFMRLQRRADAAFRVENHIPSQVRDLSSSKTCLHGEQDDDAVADWLAGRLGEHEQIVDMVGC
jgi:hypothetical protein